jgi:hypothetical protein
MPKYKAKQVALPLEKGTSRRSNNNIFYRLCKFGEGLRSPQTVRTIATTAIRMDISAREALSTSTAKALSSSMKCCHPTLPSQNVSTVSL